MTRAPIGPNPCLVDGCGAVVQRSRPAYAVCRACHALAWAAFKRQHAAADPLAWARAHSRVFGDIGAVVALARAERAGVAA